jgi:hypothetical protein
MLYQALTSKDFESRFDPLSRLELKSPLIHINAQSNSSLTQPSLSFDVPLPNGHLSVRSKPKSTPSIAHLCFTPNLNRFGVDFVVFPLQKGDFTLSFSKTVGHLEFKAESRFSQLDPLSFFVSGRSAILSAQFEKHKDGSLSGTATVTVPRFSLKTTSNFVSTLAVVVQSKLRFGHSQVSMEIDRSGLWQFEFCAEHRSKTWFEGRIALDSALALLWKGEGVLKYCEQRISITKPKVTVRVGVGSSGKKYVSVKLPKIGNVKASVNFGSISGNEWPSLGIDAKIRA